MRATVEDDDDLLRESQELIGTTTARETVDFALRGLVARHQCPGVLDLRGRRLLTGKPRRESPHPAIRSGVMG